MGKGSTAVGQRIKDLRNAKKLTQKQLAEKAGCAMMTIQRYEAGTTMPKRSILEKIASVLGVSVADIAGMEFDMDLWYAEGLENAISDMDEENALREFYSLALLTSASDLQEKPAKHYYRTAMKQISVAMAKMIPAAQHKVVEYCLDLLHNENNLRDVPVKPDAAAGENEEQA